MTFMQRGRGVERGPAQGWTQGWARASARVLSVVLLALVPLVRAQQVDPAADEPAPPAVAPTSEREPPHAVPIPPAESDSVDAGMRAKVQQTIDAYAQATSLSFHSKTTYTGFLEGRSFATEGDIRMTRPAAGSGWLIRATGTGRKKPSDEPAPFDVLWSQTAISWLDASAKKLFERPSGQGRGTTVQMAVGAVPTQINEHTPFARESTAETVTLDSSDPIGGIACELLSFRTRGKRGILKFWVGVDDHLIRKFERASEPSTYSSSTIIEFSGLKLNDPITPESLAIELPVDFTRDSIIQPEPVSPKPVVTTAPDPAAVTQRSAPQHSTAISPTGTQPMIDENANPSVAGGVPNRPSPDSIPPQFPSTPTFTVAALDGTLMSSESFRGQPTVLMFFGSWSLASRAGEPELWKAVQEAKAAAKENPPGVDSTAGDTSIRFLALAVRERSKENASEFVTTTTHPWTLVPAGDDAARIFAIHVYPTFVMINADGRIAARVEGVRKDSAGDALAKAARAMLGIESSVPLPAESVKPPAQPESAEPTDSEKD